MNDEIVQVENGEPVAPYTPRPMNRHERRRAIATLPRDRRKAFKAGKQAFLDAAIAKLEGK